MLMAGLDGIQNKIHPGDAADEDLYELPAAEQAKIPTVAAGLDAALEGVDQASAGGEAPVHTIIRVEGRRVDIRYLLQGLCSARRETCALDAGDISCVQVEIWW